MKKVDGHFTILRSHGEHLPKNSSFKLGRFSGRFTAFTDLKTRISLYCIRARIENSFREFKQVIGGFAYHFWTRAMPRLNHFRKSGDPDPMDSVTSWDCRARIVMTVRAIDFFALTACIAQGIIQMISVTCDFTENEFRWQRTPVNLDRPSEANVKDYLQKSVRAYLLESVQVELGKVIMKRLQPEKFAQFLTDPDSDA